MSRRSTRRRKWLPATSRPLIRMPQICPHAPPRDLNACAIPTPAPFQPLRPKKGHLYLPAFPSQPNSICNAYTPLCMRHTAPEEHVRIHSSYTSPRSALTNIRSAFKSYKSQLKAHKNGLFRHKSSLCNTPAPPARPRATQVKPFVVIFLFCK